jgi:hypothetical protein
MRLFLACLARSASERGAAALYYVSSSWDR